MMRQSAENTSLATRNNSRGRFLGPLRNSRASTVPSLPVPGSCTCHDTNARVGTDTLDYRPPCAARTTLWAASRTFDLWIRRFPAGISVGDPVLKRGHSNTTAISVPADCGWLRGGEGVLRWSVRWTASLLLAMVGTLFLVGGLPGPNFRILVTPAGVVFGLLAAVSGAYYTLASRPLVRVHWAWWGTTWGFMIGALQHSRLELNRSSATSCPRLGTG